MAFSANQQFTGGPIIGGTRRVFPRNSRAGTFTAQPSLVSIPEGTALAVDAAGNLVPWDKSLASQFYTLRYTGTAATGGTFRISGNGGSWQTATIAHDATAAAVKAAIVAVAGMGVLDVEVNTVGANTLHSPFGTIYNIRFIGQYLGIASANTVLTISNSSLTGTDTPTAVLALVETGGTVATTSKVYKVVLTGTITGGSFTFSTANVPEEIPFDATAAEFAAVVNAALGRDVVEVWGAPNTWYVRFTRMAVGAHPTPLSPVLEIELDNLVGSDLGQTVTVFEDGGATRKENTLVGICWPDDVTVSSTGDVIGQMMLMGRVHANDIRYTASSDVGYAGSLNPIKDTLQTGSRALGIVVEGLAGIR